MSVITIATAITNIETIRHEIILQKKSEEMMAKRLDFAWLQALDADRGGGVDKLAFLVGILSHLGKLDYQEDVEPWLKVRQGGGKGSIGRELKVLEYYLKYLMSDSYRIAAKGTICALPSSA